MNRNPRLWNIEGPSQEVKLQGHAGSCFQWIDSGWRPSIQRQWCWLEGKHRSETCSGSQLWRLVGTHMRFPLLEEELDAEHRYWQLETRADSCLLLYLCDIPKSLTWGFCADMQRRASTSGKAEANSAPNQESTKIRQKGRQRRRDEEKEETKEEKNFLKREEVEERRGKRNEKEKEEEETLYVQSLISPVT